MSAADLGKLDAIVLGEGPAGFAAALTLHERGKRVAVVAKSPGAASVSSGRWGLGTPEAFGALLVEWTPPAASEVLATAREMARALQPHLGIEFAQGEAFQLPDSTGRLQATLAAQAIQAACHAALHGERPVRLVGSPAWRFRSDRVAEAWNRLGVGKDVRILNWEFPLPGRDWPLPHLAARLRDDGALFEKMVALLSEAPGEPFLILPPLLLERAQIERLHGALPGRWAECVATREPIAGMRLQNAFRAVLAERGIPRLVGSQLQVKTDGPRLDSISIFSAEGWRKLEADRVVLATGRFLGGGLTLLPAGPRESLLGLPLFTARDKAIRLGDPELFRGDTSWPTAGVWVDARCRPVGGDGKAMFENVHATGSLLGGIDGARADFGIGALLHLGRHCALVAE